MNLSISTRLIRQESKRLGFDFCGISKAEFLKEEAQHLEEWLKKGMHGKMKYMEDSVAKRLYPRKLLPEAKSVISLLLNYFPALSPFEGGASASGGAGDVKDEVKISKYAYGKDYHFVIKEKLFRLIEFIKEKIGNVNALACVDSAPVMDKVWAKKSGLGWLGKHSNLIVKNRGSYFFLAELIVDLELEYNRKIPNYCGTCTKCIDACPTQAIVKPYIVDGSKCISYFTIELKGNIPDEVKGKFDGWLFGCDVCQDVCPWNSFSTASSEPHFKPKPEILGFTKNDWEELTEDTFKRIFHDSPLMRTKYKGIKRNLQFLFSPLEKHVPNSFREGRDVS